MRHKEKQACAWKKISYATKPFNHLGIVRLGIPQCFDMTDTQEMWDHIQQPYITPEWMYITDAKMIDALLVQ